MLQWKYDKFVITWFICATSNLTKASNFTSHEYIYFLREDDKTEIYHIDILPEKTFPLEIILKSHTRKMYIL